MKFVIFSRDDPLRKKNGKIFFHENKKENIGLDEIKIQSFWRMK